MCGITALLTASALVSGSKVWKAARLSASFPSMAVLQTHADLAGAEDQHKGGTISVLRMQNIYHRRQQWFVWGFPCNLEIQERLSLPFAAYRICDSQLQRCPLLLKMKTFFLLLAHPNCMRSVSFSTTKGLGYLTS